ncbi:MAG: hypothetical protein K1X53_13835 [Candidatus Sumerlaeaceae bacterium]|nr:hypothetical protein [Candidatus Sumerlaeaceae bacterium]
MIAVCAMTICPLSAGAVDPTGDYGDAPDDGSHKFPTKYATTNSRSGGLGAHHTVPAPATLGPSSSTEAGAEDPSDPDGIANLTGTPDHDAFDDGLIGMDFLPVGVPFPAFTPFASRVTARIQVCDHGPTTKTRYLNVLVDKNRDQEWRNTASGNEWVVVNLPVEIQTTNTCEILDVTFDDVVLTGTGISGDMWARFTLSDTAIPETGTAGGWDGSGTFAEGETEDYKLFDASAPWVPVPPPIPPPGGCNCTFKLKCKPKTLVLLHGNAGAVTLEITVRGTTGCSAEVTAITAGGIGPMFGLGVYNGPEVGQVTPPALPLVFNGAGTYNVVVPIAAGTVHNIGAIQSFDVKFRVAGYCGTTKVYAARKTCGVLIIHPEVNCNFGLLEYGPDDNGPGVQYPQNTPIQIPAVAGFTTAPQVRVSFGRQDTSGTLFVAEVNDYPPGIHTTSSIVKSYWLVARDDEETTEPSGGTIQTELIGMGLTSTPLRYNAAGITDPNTARIFKFPLQDYAHETPLFDLWDERQMDGGSGTLSQQQAQTGLFGGGSTERVVLGLRGLSIFGISGPVGPVPVTVSRWNVD